MQSDRISDPTETLRAYSSIDLRDKSIGFLCTELALRVEDITLSVSYHTIYWEKSQIKDSMESISDLHMHKNMIRIVRIMHILP